MYVVHSLNCETVARNDPDLAVVLKCWVGVQVFDTKEEEKALENP